MTDTEDESDRTNISRLRQMAVRGDDYRDTMDFNYYGEEGELWVRPLTDDEFLPIATFLESRLDIDPEEAQKAIEEEREASGGEINPEDFDREFVDIMKEAAVFGIATDGGIAEGETEQGIREIVGATDNEEDNIGLQGGKTLLIAERVLEISSDAESAKSFRRDGGGE